MKSVRRALLFCSAKKGARMYACMPAGYCEPSVVSSSTETSVVIGYLVKNCGSTASACLMKLIWSVVESQRGLVGNGTYHVLWLLTIWTLEFAFFKAATNALVSEMPKRYLGETMKILLTPSLAASLPAAVPSIYVLGTIDTQYGLTMSGWVVSCQLLHVASIVMILFCLAMGLSARH